MRGALIFLSLALAGCSHGPELTGTHVVQSNLETLSGRMDRLEEAYQATNPAINLTLDDSGFSTIRTEYGPITIQWQAAVANSAGSKLTFRIGNPLAAKLSGIAIYGHAVGKDGTDLPSSVSPWQLKGNALSGAWTKLTTIIVDVPPKKIGSLRITGAKVGGLGLTAP